MPWTDPTFWAWIFVISEWAIRLVMLAVVPFRRTPAAAKGWLLVIFFEPWVGLVLYLLIGRASLPRWRRRQVAKLPRAMAPVRARLANHPNVFHPEVGPVLAPAVTLAENLGQMPILGGMRLNSWSIMTERSPAWSRTSTARNTTSTCCSTSSRTTARRPPWSGPSAGPPSGASVAGCSPTRSARARAYAPCAPS